jgi:hypothetical protein
MTCTVLFLVLAALLVPSPSTQPNLHLSEYPVSWLSPTMDSLGNDRLLSLFPKIRNDVYRRVLVLTHPVYINTRNMDFRNVGIS